MILMRNKLGITDIDLFETVGKQRPVPLDHPLITAARAIGTSFGDGAGSIIPKPIPAALA